MEESKSDNKVKQIKNEQYNYPANIQENDLIVDNLTAITWNRLLYLPDIKDALLQQEIKEKVFNIIDDEKNWKQRLG